MKRQAGFTLVEIILSIAILAILSGIVIGAINIERNLKEARDAQRLVDVHTILNAVYQYALDNDGSFPAEITTSNQEICKTSELSCDGIRLLDLTDNSKYLISFPVDPQKGEEPGIGYFISTDGNGHITVIATGSELGEDETATR